MSKFSIQDEYLYSGENKISKGIYNSSPPSGKEYSYHYVNNYEHLFEEIEDYVNDDLYSKIKEAKFSVLPKGLCLIKCMSPFKPDNNTKLDNKAHLVNEIDPKNDNKTLYINVSALPSVSQSVDILPSPIRFMRIGKDDNDSTWYSANFQISGIVKGIDRELLVEKFQNFCDAREIIVSFSEIDTKLYSEIQSVVDEDITVEEAFSVGIDKATSIIDKFIFSLIGLEGALEVWEYWENNRTKELTEPTWQGKFEQYPWLLAQCFAVPHIIFQEQCYIGGTTPDGKGSKFPDFVYMTSGTENMMVVEIKTPDQHLMVDTGRSNIFAPSANLNKGVGQALFYKDLALKSYSTYLLNQSIAGKKNELKNLRNPRCLLVIGSLSEFTGDNGEAAKNCFDIYRNELRSLEIITYDELFEKLRTMMRLVASRFCVLT
ncbi:Shedu immune nuclease family protein [Peribacillus asahii]|uniref:Shedu immune nuclease family protein n=1 Tax=Peribacillus asahii TaxID=228899 RepID=UPI003808CCD6